MVKSVVGGTIVVWWPKLLSIALKLLESQASHLLCCLFLFLFLIPCKCKFSLVYTVISAFVLRPRRRNSLQEVKRDSLDGYRTTSITFVLSLSWSYVCTTHWLLVPLFVCHNFILFVSRLVIENPSNDQHDDERSCSHVLLLLLFHAIIEGALLAINDVLSMNK